MSTPFIIFAATTIISLAVINPTLAFIVLVNLLVCILVGTALDTIRGD